MYACVCVVCVCMCVLCVLCVRVCMNVRRCVAHSFSLYFLTVMCTCIVQAVYAYTNNQYAIVIAFDADVRKVEHHGGDHE